MMISGTTRTCEWYRRNPPPGFARPKISQEIQETDSIRAAILSINSLEIKDDDDDDHTRIFDIDSNVKDPLLCPELADDVFKNLRSHESQKRPHIDYMEKVQKFIHPRTRAHFADLLIYMADRLEYNRDTLHLSINYLDRYLSENKVVDEKHLILIGLSCMIIASKYEEIRPPHDFDFLDDYIYLGKDKFSREEFIQTERSILGFLEYDVAAPTTWSFLQRFVRAAQGGKKAPLKGLEITASYIADFSLLSYEMLRFLPSLVAASSVFLAQYILVPQKRPWNATLQRYTLYRPSDLRDCVMALHGFCYDGSNTLALIRMKYSRKMYERVALKSFPSSIPPEFFHDF